MQPQFDSTRRLARLLDGRRYYLQMLRVMLPRVPLPVLLRSHYPFSLPDGVAPALVRVEFTNYCNLRCPYCTSPLGLRERGMMSEETFALLVRQIRQLRVSRISVVGNGESTLHPRFDFMIRELARACRVLQLVTNGQRLTQAHIDTILEAPVRLLHLSVDGGDKATYESSRIGGSFEQLLDGLTRLKQRKRELRSPTLITIRLMLRPSQRQHQWRLMDFWRPYGDSVLPQYLGQLAGATDPDVYTHVQSSRDEYPRCTIPFKSLVIHWNGNVPLCGPSAGPTGEPEGWVMGNIHSTTLAEIWQGPTLKQYREGHRKRDASRMPICKGCRGE